LLSGVLLPAEPQPAHADGGTIRVSAREGSLQITVFTSPSPGRAGPIDVSVFVQDAVTGQPVPGARVFVRAESRDHPERFIERPATTDDATNKLLVAALFDLPATGRWEFRVRIEGHGRPAEVAFEMEVDEPPPGWLTLAGWVAWPAVVVALVAIHRILVRLRDARLGR
jgi:hypothetical protein